MHDFEGIDGRQSATGADNLTEEQIRCEEQHKIITSLSDTALDAIASLRLHEVLVEVPGGAKVQNQGDGCEHTCCVVHVQLAG